MLLLQVTGSDTLSSLQNRKKETIPYTKKLRPIIVYIRYQVLMAGVYRLRSSGLWHRAVLWVDSNVPDKHCTAIFRDAVTSNPKTKVVAFRTIGIQLKEYIHPSLFKGGGGVGFQDPAKSRYLRIINRPASFFSFSSLEHHAVWLENLFESSKSPRICETANYEPAES
jgi:hypothetical protein